MKLLLGLVAFLITPVVGLLGKTNSNIITTHQDDIEISQFDGQTGQSSPSQTTIDEVIPVQDREDRSSNCSKAFFAAKITNGPLNNLHAYSLEQNPFLAWNSIVDREEDRTTFSMYIWGSPRGSETLRITYSNNGCIDTQVYVSSIDGHSCISTVSQEQADMFIELNELENGRINDDYFLSHNNERNAPFIDYSAPLQGLNYYRFQLRNDNSVIEPLKYVAVECLDSQNISLSVLQTDQNGRIYKSDLASGTHHLRVCSYSMLNSSDEVVGVEKSHDFQNSYYFQDISLVSDGFGRTITFNTRKNGQLSYLGCAFQVLKTMILGASYVQEMSGGLPSMTRAVYPHSDGCYYDRFDSTIYLREATYCYPDAILHEYGHHLQKENDLSGRFGGKHFIEVYALEEGKKQEGLNLTWGEAWPTVFGIMVGQFFPDEFNNSSSTDSIYNSDVGSFNLETPSVKYGEGCENDIIAVLYDLYDPLNESHDFFNLGHQGLWDLMMNAADGPDPENMSDWHLNTFDDFAQYFYLTHSLDEINYFGKITSELGFSPTPIIDGIGTFSESPLIHWRKTNAVYDANGNLDTTVPAYYSNNYKITFYDGYRNEIFTKTATTESYRLSSDDPSGWRTVLSSYSTHYYVRVSSEQNNGGAPTGAYKSDLFFVEKPQLADFNESLSFGSDKRIIARPIYLAAGQSIAYTITSSKGGEVVFQTVGSEGTRLYLYDDNNVLLAQSGYQSGYHAYSYYHNGLIRYTLQANVPYKLKVESMVNGASLNNTKLIVCRPLAFTQNWNPYNTAVSLENIVSDNFYYGLWCERYKLSLFNYTPSTSGRHSIQLSSGFDSYLYVIDSYTGQMWQDDDSAGNLDAKVTINNMVAGRKYLVAFTQYNPTSTLSDGDVEVHMWKN